MNANNVTNVLAKQEIKKDTKEFTLERSLSNAKNVRNVLGTLEL